MALEGVKSEKSEENNGNVPDGKANGIDNKSKQIEPNTAFLRAARAGQLDTVVDLLDSGAVKDINTCNSNGLNALHLAAKDGHISVVEELLKRGATVDAATKKGNTALHIACLAGQESVARALLAAGAKADAQSAAGFTPLYMAAQENHAGCVKMLLAAGASQTLATEDGFTPLAVAMQQGHDRVVAELLESDTRGKVRLPALHIAAKKNDVKAATLLLENEHNPDACSKSGFTPLHIAAHYGNVGVAKALLAAGADSGRAAKHNITPLHVASKWGQLAMVDLLVENGANIAAVTRDGLTPLHCAARSGHSNVVSRLLQHGAPITSKTKNGLTPLHMSVQGEHVETAKVLLAEGAPIDDVTVDYLTALHVAAHCGHVKVAKLLLDRNADANARALNGFTPLHIACKKNRLKVVELLLKYGASKSATTESGLTALHVASFMGCMNVALVLVGAGAGADAATARGETPLHLAARAHQTDLVRVLLRNGARVDAKAREDQTPLHVAARLGHADIAALLLQHGADVAAATKDRYTPLHIAAKEGKEEVAAILLDHNAPIEAETRKGFTPLHLAAKYGDIGVARLLLARGAQPDAPGKSHITPLHMATYYGHPDIALLLLDKGASPHSLAKNGHSALHIACRHNHPDIAFALLEHDADPGVKSKAGFTPLHMAAQEGHEDCVEMLIERGADVNVPANNGLTPVHLAAAEGRTRVLGAALAAGGRVGARTRDGYTPLHAAAHHGHHAAAKVLLDAEADVSARAAHGFTPLHQAAQQGHTLIIQLLLKNNADPNALSATGQTPCAIADRLGYISAVEALRPVTENTLSQAVGDTGGLEGKYRVAAPELMQDTFMSDSEDEGGEVECPIQQQQQYRYMNSEAGTLHRAKPLEDSVTDGHLWPSNNDRKVATIERQPVDIGFLVSFVVDARGGAMKAKRRGGVRIIVPPAACAAPTRVTCRAATRRAPAAAPPPLMEGEALASRLLELQPQGAKFLAPVIIEVPIFTSSCPEREIVILRSDNGETWQDHYLHNNDNPMIQEALQRERQEFGPSGEAVGESGERVTRIVTCEFPHYLACVSRVRQEVHVIGPDGGAVSSAHIAQVQAVFPPAALTKRIRVGLQAHGASTAAVQRVLPRHAAVSPVVTVEPRRRKFHRSITLTVPLPPSPTGERASTSNLRLLCSIMGGQARAVWEDVTGSTPLTITDDCASFTTTVSARFWLMNCQNVSDATKLATELYREMLLVPFEVRIVVLGKRLDALEGRLLVMTITDRYAYDTLLQQEHYTEVAHSTSVKFLDGKDVYLEFSGNLVPVTKSGSQPMLTFEAFKDNRVEFTVRVKHHEESPSGRIYFMNEPKVPKGEQSQTPTCVLDVELPERIAPRAGKSQLDYLNLDQSGFDALKDELSFHWGEHNNSLGPGSLPYHDRQVNGHLFLQTETKSMKNIIDPTRDKSTFIK
ncbi:ankyrin-3 isoform X4 [Manduca sexta]|uniref:ankyrin-3 isoform X4 n=1 Tax=Manduca sexta TaxID=7130 RepID=UPI00188DF1EE|nr:ankyrin-3 isoform X4 [Manduca sexta]